MSDATTIDEPVEPTAAAALDAADPLGSLTLLVMACRARAQELRGDTDDRLRQLARRLEGDGPLPLSVAIEGCALAAEATRRVLGVELHDEQLLASLALACGWTTEVRTGEGKTFVAIGPALVFARWLGSAHVVTANAYLAARDAEWSGAVLRSLGLTVAVTLPNQLRDVTRAAYEADVVYGAAADFGFDLLRDQLCMPGDPPVQRSRHAAIVDEADAVFIDQAVAPLVLSAPAPSDAASIRRASEAVGVLDPATDLDLNEALGESELTDSGVLAVEHGLGIKNLYDVVATDWPQLVRMAIRARTLLVRDRDYVLQDGAVEVVDETTGRIIDGRRWSEGLHQAVEAKEGLEITSQRRAIGRTTTAGYFSGYQLLVGMSGTLTGTQKALGDRLGVRVLEVPTHRPVVRDDHADAEFASPGERTAAIADDARTRRAAGQPVLIGTTSIAQSMEVSEALTAVGVEHRVLSATNDHEEAAIIAEAGAAGAVTVATQMAGRGVDIVLGGARPTAEEAAAVRAAGGLMVWGVEHHPSRRLDEQLRGRAGRQGDPGTTCFAVTPDDDLLLDWFEHDPRTR